MAVNNGLVITLFILVITSLAIGYGFGVKAQRLPFSAEIGFSEQQYPNQPAFSNRGSKQYRLITWKNVYEN